MLQLLLGLVLFFCMHSMSVVALPKVFEEFFFVLCLAHRVLVDQETDTGRSRVNGLRNGRMMKWTGCTRRHASFMGRGQWNARHF